MTKKPDRLVDSLDPDVKDSVLTHLLDGNFFKAVKSIRLQGFSLVTSRNIAVGIAKEEGFAFLVPERETL